MSNEKTDHWKLTSLALILVFATAAVTGWVMATRTPDEHTKQLPAATKGAVRHVSLPSTADIEACNQYAKSETSSSNTKEVVTDAVIGGAAGAGVGAAGGAIAGGGKDAGKGAAIGGIVGATAGTLYGLNETHKNDSRVQAAYAECMKRRGF
jgi:hypothetical protein